MKKKPILICILLCVFLLVSLTGCGEKKEQVLSGSYTSQGILNKMNYTFDKEKNVTACFLAGGYSVNCYAGTYEINEDGSLITFSFPTAEEGAGSYLPSGMTSLGGAFSFKQEEDCVWIGTVCYHKDTVDTESDETAQPDMAGTESDETAQPDMAGTESDETTQPDREGQSSDSSSAGGEAVALDQIHLVLPETYALSYEVTEESSGISRTYTQAIACADEGIFLDLGDSNEKYVFERLDSGKYTEYCYNALTDKYETPLISAVVQKQIDEGIMTVDMVAVDSKVVDGYTARVDTCFDFYEEFREYLDYQGQETVEGVDCQKYAASYKTAAGEQSVKLWIDPQTGLCVKGIYQYRSAVGVTGAKTILCTKMETDQVEIPAYR